MNENFNNQNENTEEFTSINEEINHRMTDTTIEDILDTDSPNVDDPIYSPVNFTKVTPMADYKPMSKGLKVFVLVLSIVIALTTATLGGYFAGKNNFVGKSPVKLQLESQPSDKNELTPSAVYEKVNPSIVGITTYNTEGKGGQSSGIIYSKDGYIITNDHIYSSIPNAKFKIHTFDGTEFNAHFVAGDLISDLAVLKIDNCNLTPAKFANSDDLYMGQRVVAIGRPNDATDASSITSGIISATNRRVSNASSYPARLIQTDSPINPGSSGGALVNMYGQVVGVTSSKLASIEYEGVGYAIPTTVMKRIVTELINKGKVVSRAKLGISYVAVNSVTAEINGLSTTGLRVESVTRDSDLFGKISNGDIITKINNITISSDDMVLDIIEGCVAGDKITVTVLTKSGSTKSFTAELRANIGESSYKTGKTDNNSSNQASGGTFNFPSGE